MTDKKPIFSTEAGTKISRLNNDRQLKKFLSCTWQQKSLRIDGAPGLSIHQSGRWHFDLMAGRQRLSTTIGRYPEVSLAEARNKALSMRQNFLETGTRPNPKKIQPDKDSGSHSPLNGSTDDTIDSLLPEYLHYRYDELLESKTNKHPDKAILVMEARYHKYLAPLIGKLHPTQLSLLEKALSEGNLQTKLNELNKVKLLIIDELGYLPFSPSASHLLFQLINCRYESKSTIITSNRSPGEWGLIFGDPTAATAILDRLLHHCIPVTIMGDSYRVKAGKKALLK